MINATGARISSSIWCGRRDWALRSRDGGPIAVQKRSLAPAILRSRTDARPLSQIGTGFDSATY